MSNAYPHTASSLYFSCIDDRLVRSTLEFIIDHGNAFHPSLAGGGAAFNDPSERIVALKQIVAAYQIAGVTEIYLVSHTDCGAYRLAGITFSSIEDESAQLYADLESASNYAREALHIAGANPDSIKIHIRVVDPAGKLVERVGELV